MNTPLDGPIFWCLYEFSLARTDFILVWISSNKEDAEAAMVELQSKGHRTLNVVEQSLEGIKSQVLGERLSGLNGVLIAPQAIMNAFKLTSLTHASEE